MCLVYVFKIIWNERKFHLNSIENWFLRIGFSVCIYKICSNDLYSVEVIRSISDCGLYRNKNNTILIFIYMVNSLRVYISCLSTIAITIFIWSIDKDGYENVLDQIKDFTALVIIIQIDD